MDARFIHEPDSGATGRFFRSGCQTGSYGMLFIIYPSGFLMRFDTGDYRL